MPHCVAVQRRSWGRYFAALKKLQKQCPKQFWLFHAEISRNVSTWVSQSLITVTSVENPQFVELPPQRIVGIVRWVLQRAWSGVSGRGSFLDDLFSPFLLGGACSFAQLINLLLVLQYINNILQLESFLSFASQSSHLLNFDRCHLSFPMRTICGVRYNISTVFT